MAEPLEMNLEALSIEEQHDIALQVGTALLDYLATSAQLGHTGPGNTWRYLKPDTTDQAAALGIGTLIVLDVMAVESSDPAAVAERAKAQKRLRWLAERWTPGLVERMEMVTPGEVK